MWKATVLAPAVALAIGVAALSPSLRAQGGQDRPTFTV